MKYARYLYTTMLFVSAQASANPEGGKVVAGSAAVSSKGALLEVQQRTDRAVIEWKKFDIAAHEHTKFIQPSANSVVLNRVRSDRASEIMGKLTANGKVVIVNPNGLRLWLDAADRSKITLTYSNDSLSSAAVDRTSSNTLLT